MTAVLSQPGRMRSMSLTGSLARALHMEGAAMSLQA
jgi:hypothetical protein